MLTLSGGLVLILGAVLTIGGHLLVEDSSYCALAGAGLMLAGALIAKRNRAGAWAFMAVFAITLAWSLRNLEGAGTFLVMRLLGPAILLAMIALLMPSLRGWRARRTIAVFTAVLAGMIGVGILSVATAPFAWPPTAVSQLPMN